MRVQFLKALLSGILLAALFLPVVQMRFGLFNLSGVEDRRELVSFSDLDLRNPGRLPFELDRYFGDHYGFRTFLIKVANSLRYYVLGVSPTEDVILGRNGWLFYASPTDGDIRGDYARSNTVSPEELEWFRDAMVERNAELKRMGITYVLVLVPDKGSVYPEHLPRRYQRYAGQPGRYDQIAGYLKTHTDITVVDVKRHLLDARQRMGEDLYNRRGTHWNALGAFVGYRAVMDTVLERHPFVGTLSLEDLERTTRRRIQGLQQTLGVFSPHVSEEPLLMPKEKTREHGDLLDIEVFGDSFFDVLEPYVSAHAGKLVRHRSHHVVMNHVRSQQPDLVIHEIVERYFDHLVGAEAHYNRGVDLETKQMYEEALEEYQAALRLKPAYAPAHFGSGTIHLRLKDYYDAIGSFETGLLLDPRSLDARTNLGLAYARAGHFDEAYRELRSVLDRDPYNMAARDNMRILRKLQRE